MDLSVRHTTVYAFDAPMRLITQSQRLTPANNAGQQVLDWSVTAEGAVFGASFVDGAGDRIATMTLQGPVARVEVIAQGRARTTDTTGVLRDHREVVSPHAYLRATTATAASAALGDLGRAALQGADPGDDLARAHRLAEAVADAVAYASGETGAHTTAAEALAQGRGVCQDHAHVMIALALQAGLPARYVTGYLLAGPETNREDATHAWAEVHVGRLGWIGFDAANRCCPDARYIRLASGRDAQEAAPIRGVSRGTGLEALAVSVAVSQTSDGHEPDQGQTTGQSQEQ